MNMYVSNLGYHTSEEDLRKLFEAFGKVSSAKLIKDRDTGNSRGFGFVEMDSESEASQAMNKLNGNEMEGRFISVTIAREKKDRDNGFSNKRY